MKIMLSIFLFALKEAEDPGFIAKLYLDYRYLVRSEIRRIYRDKNNVEDIMQDIFVKLIRHEAKLREIEPDKRVSYIIKTTHTTVFNFMSKAKKEAFNLPMEEVENLSDPANPLEKVILDLDTMEQFRTIYDAMKPREALILQLKYDLEYTDAEIAEELGIKPQCVHVLVYNARKSFKRILEIQTKRDKRIYGENAVSLR